jgi:hypothetical protein
VLGILVLTLIAAVLNAFERRVLKYILNALAV